MNPSMEHQRPLPAHGGLRFAAALRAVQHEVDAVLAAEASLLSVREAYVLGRAVEGLALTARLNGSAAVVESGLRRLLRSLPPSAMSAALERAVGDAVALCVDPLPLAMADNNATFPAPLPGG
jgi:hypothetical protein